MKDELTRLESELRTAHADLAAFRAEVAKALDGPQGHVVPHLSAILAAGNDQ